jgi:hypothetical protein
MRLGELVAQPFFDSRAADGSTGVDSYRPRTQPGVYVPTATMVAATWPTLRPLVLERPDQFRPGPPVALASQEWASDYNEVKTYGARNSTLRTPEQTETAKFWLMTGPQAYHPIVRQLISARHVKLVDSARFMAAFATAMTDAYIAVFEAKYHYEFWRPITATRATAPNAPKLAGRCIRSLRPSNASPSHALATRSRDPFAGHPGRII